MENCETIEKLHLVVCGNDCMNIFLKSGFDKLAYSLNIAVLMHPNGPKCLINE